MRLSRKRAIVTGGASGIGRAICHRFAAEGAAVVIADRNRDGAERVRQEILEAGGTASVETVDVTGETQVGAMVEVVANRLGGVDLLVNNAISEPADDLLEMSTRDWDTDVEITLRAPFLCTRAVLPRMIDGGGGSIVNISSVNALGFFGNEAYSAGKAALINLTKATAVRYGHHGVRANAIAAGTVRTPVWDDRAKLDPQIFDRLAEWYPTGRVGEPGDVAHAALFLASDEASWITGAVLPVDGGLTSGPYRMNTELVPEPGPDSEEQDG